MQDSNLVRQSFSDREVQHFGGTAFISQRESYLGDDRLAELGGDSCFPAEARARHSPQQKSSTTARAIYILVRVLCSALLVCVVFGILLSFSTQLAKDGYLGRTVNCDETQVEHGLIVAGKLGDRERVKCDLGFALDFSDPEPRRCRLVMKSCIETSLAGGPMLKTVHTGCPDGKSSCLKVDKMSDREWCKTRYAWATVQQAANARAEGADEASVAAALKRTTKSPRCVPQMSLGERTQANVVRAYQDSLPTTIPPTSSRFSPSRLFSAKRAGKLRSVQRSTSRGSQPAPGQSSILVLGLVLMPLSALLTTAVARGRRGTAGLEGLLRSADDGSIVRFVDTGPDSGWGDDVCGHGAASDDGCGLE